MKADLSNLNAFLAVARAKGFREGARASGSSASGLGGAVSRLEAQLGVRLLHRTTRSVVPTEAGAWPGIDGNRISAGSGERLSGQTSGHAKARRPT
jgi:hypothetical protein